MGLTDSLTAPGFTPLDLVVLFLGIAIFFITKNWLGSTLKNLFRLAIVLMFVVVIYGVTSSVGKVIIKLNPEKTLTSSIIPGTFNSKDVEAFQSFIGGNDGSTASRSQEDDVNFFQSFMGVGSQSWIEEHSMTWDEAHSGE